MAMWSSRGGPQRREGKQGLGQFSETQLPQQKRVSTAPALGSAPGARLWDALSPERTAQILDARAKVDP